MILDLAQLPPGGFDREAPLRIYTGILGQIGDIVTFTPTARRLKQIFPNSFITFAVAAKYREAGSLVAGLPYVDQVFVTQLYFERLTSEVGPLWENGWPIDLRGPDEVEEQARHDLIFETRPRMRRMPWWDYGHLVAERAYNLGIPGPLDLQTDIVVPQGTAFPPHAAGKIVLQNDPNISPHKAWSWDEVKRLVTLVGEGEIVLLGGEGPNIPGTIDLRCETTLSQAAAIIAASRCYVGIDSGLLWIAASLQVPTVGIFGTSYVPTYEAGYPKNPKAIYLQAEGPPERVSAEEVVAAMRQLC